MECSTVSVDVDGYSTIISSTTPKARKNHKCHECYRQILPGEKYERYIGKGDEIFTHKTCMDCLSVRDEFFRDGYYFETIWENLEEHIRECGGDISESSLCKLTPVARARVCEAIEECWDDED
jgi:hypothetical protein